MPPLNSRQYLSSKLQWYVLVKMLLVLLIVSPLIPSSGVWFQTFLSLFLGIVLPIWIYLVISYRFISYAVGERSITINSGILFKRSRTISFSNIQNSDSSRGPLSSIFGLSRLKIWTASPSQIRIREGNSKNIPEGQIWLETQTADSIKNFVLSKK